MYLAQFGYLSPSVRNPSSGGLIDASTWTSAISEFQSFAGINATGNNTAQNLIKNYFFHFLYLPK